MLPTGGTVPSFFLTLKNPMSKESAEHHLKAAEHHEHAARHHREAARHYAAGNYEKAAHHAHVAHGHDVHADYHAEEAAKHAVAAFPDIEITMARKAFMEEEL